VALNGETILRLAADRVSLGDVLPGLAHRLGRMELLHLRVDHPPAKGGVVERLLSSGQPPLGLRQHPGCPAHRFDPAGQVEVPVAEAERPGGLVDRVQSRGAQPVHGDPGRLDREARQKRRHPGDVPVVLAGLVGGAHVDLVDPRGVEAVAIDYRADHVGREIVRADPGEGAAIGAHRGSEGVDDHRLGHGLTVL